MYSRILELVELAIFPERAAHAAFFGLDFAIQNLIIQV